VRAIAAYLVFFHHFNPFPLNSANGALVAEGHIGVSVFFVLSGLLITIRYQTYMNLSKDWVIKYARNRIARIYPIYFLLTVLTFLVIAYDPTYDPLMRWAIDLPIHRAWIVALNLTFLRGFFNDICFSGVAQGWTLTVEECFYFSAPLLLLALRRTTWALVAYVVVLLAVGLAVVHLLAPFQGRIPFGFLNTYAFVLNYTLFGRCLDFAAGIGLAIWVQRGGPKVVPQKPWRTLLGATWIIGCMVWLAAIAVPEGTASTIVEPMILFIRSGVLPVGIVLFFAGLIYEASMLRRLLETRVFELLGQSSYAFYLVHLGLLSYVMQHYMQYNNLLHFVVANVLSILLYLSIEKPVHRWITKPRLAVA